MLDGAKQWITSGRARGRDGRLGAHGRRRGDARASRAFLVEGGTPGLIAGKHEDKMGLRGSNTVPLTFDDCAMPPRTRSSASEGDGFKVAMMALDGGRIGIASQAVGVGARRARGGAAVRQASASSSGSPSPSSRRSSGCSPTWRPSSTRRACSTLRAA